MQSEVYGVSRVLAVSLTSQEPGRHDNERSHGDGHGRVMATATETPVFDYSPAEPVGLESNQIKSIYFRNGGLENRNTR